MHHCRQLTGLREIRCRSRRNYRLELHPSGPMKQLPSSQTSRSTQDLPLPDQVDATDRRCGPDRSFCGAHCHASTTTCTRTTSKDNFRQFIPGTLHRAHEVNNDSFPSCKRPATPIHTLREASNCRYGLRSAASCRRSRHFDRYPQRGFRPHFYRYFVFVCICCYFG